MSTPCQVRIVEEGFLSDQRTLYHHNDGIPEYIIPKIYDAYKLSGGGWEAGRAGKVASFLCAVDPGEFEPIPGNDISTGACFYYVLYLVNSQHGTLGECPGWEIEIYRPTASDKRKMTMEDMKIERNRTRLDELVKEFMK